MKRIQILIAVLLIVLSMAGSALAEGITKEQGEAILKELKSIRKELAEIKKKQLAGARPSRPARPVNAKVATLGNPILGDLKAPVTIVEFTDYQCPFCRRFYQNAFQDIKKDYIDTGKVRFVLRDLPLPFHADARPAAQAAHCAGEQDKFWEMHNALFDGSGLKASHIEGYAKKIGLDVSSFQSCVKSDRYKKDMDTDVADASKASITGTPGFVVGKTTENVINGNIISGAQPYASFKAKIDQLLAQKAPAGKTKK